MVMTANIPKHAGGRTVRSGTGLRDLKGLAQPHHALAAASLPIPVLIYLIAVVLPVGMQVGPLMLTALRLVLMVMVIPVMLGVLTGRHGRVFATDILFTAHIAWSTVALAMNNPEMVVEQMGSVGIEFLGGYFMGRAYIRNAEHFGALCRALVVIVCCMAPFALFETLTGRPLILEVIRAGGFRTVPFNYQDQRLGLDRVQMSFAHPIHFGLFCSVIFSLSFVAMEGMVGTARRFLVSGLIAACGFLSLSSGALLAIALQFGLIAWALIFSTTKHRWWYLVALFAVTYVVIDILSNRTPIQVFLSYATFSSHTAYWRAQIFEWGMKNVWMNPVFGLGFKDWIRPWYMYSGSMDNFWLVMAVRYGIPGFLTVTIGYVLVVYHILRRNFEGDLTLTQFRRAWVFTFLGLSFTLCTVHIWTNIYSFVFFILGAGVWLIKAAPRHPSSDEAPTAADEVQGRRAPTRYTRFTPMDR